MLRSADADGSRSREQEVAARGMCAAILALEAIALGLTHPGADLGRRRSRTATALLDRPRA